MQSFSACWEFAAVVSNIGEFVAPHLNIESIFTINPSRVRIQQPLVLVVAGAPWASAAAAAHFNFDL